MSNELTKQQVTDLLKEASALRRKRKRTREEGQRLNEIQCTLQDALCDESDMWAQGDTPYQDLLDHLSVTCPAKYLESLWPFFLALCGKKEEGSPLSESPTSSRRKSRKR